MSNASGQYQLSILLKLADQMSGGLSKGVRNLRAYGKEAKAVLSIQQQLSRALGKPLPTSGFDKYMGKMKAATKETRAFGTEQGKLGRRLSQPISTKGLDAQIGKLREYKRVLRSTTIDSDGFRTSVRGSLPRSGRGVVDPLDPLAPRTPRLPRTPKAPRRYSMGDRFSDAGDFLMNTRQVGNVWRDQVQSLEQYTDAATRLIRSEAGLKIIGLRADDLTKSFAAINKTSKEVSTVSRIDLTEGFTDLYQALNNVDSATKALPSAAKYMTNFRAFFGEKFGREGANEELLSSYKALEYVGATQRGEVEMDKTLQEFIRITASTSGRVTPSEILMMLRKGKVATRGLSVSGLRNAASLIEDFSAPTAGQSLMTLYGTLVQGKMKESAAAMFQKYDLLKPGGFTYKKGTTTASKVLAGGNILGPLVQKDPMEAATVLLEHLRKGGVDVENENKLREITGIMFQDRNAFVMMDTYMTQRKQIEKEAARMGVSADTYQQSKLLSIDPELKKLGQMEEYKAQMEDFKVSIGQNLLPVMTSLMGVMSPVSAFFKEYPTLSKYAAGLLIASKAGSGLLQTFSIYKQSQSMNFMRRAQADAIGLGSSMSAAERKAVGLKGRLNSAAGTFGFILKVAVYGIALEKLFELFSEMKAAREAWDNVGKVSGELGTSLGKDIADSKKRIAELRKQGLPVPAYLEESYAPKRMLQQAGSTLAGLNTSDTPPGVVGFLTKIANSVPGMNGFGYGTHKELLSRGSVDEGVSMLRNRASELDSPELMGAYRAKMFARKDVTPEMAYKSDVILHKFNPAAFAQSHVETIRMTAALAAEMGTAKQSIQAVSPPAMDAATALYNLHLPAALLPQDFNNMRAAIQNFESAVAAINLTPPPPAGVSGGGSFFGLDGWKASGGRVRKGGRYMVGERGRELFTPHEDGFITPNHTLRSVISSDQAPGKIQVYQSMLSPAPFNLGLPSPFGKQPFVFPSKASGGMVERGGFVHVHDKEAIVPARVTRRWRDSENFRPNYELFRQSAREDRGNVISPALLSRQAPGDWLKDSEAIKSGQASLSRRTSRDGFVTPHHDLFRGSPDVAEGLRGDALGAAVSDNRTSENNFHISLQVTGDIKDAERLSDEIVSKLEAKIAALDRKTSSVRHFNRVGVRALEIGQERG